MDEKDIHTMIQSWENIALLVRYIADYPGHIDVIMTKALDDSQPENWRAAWMIDKINEKNPAVVLPYLPAMTDFLLTTKNDSKRRHFLKLIGLHDIPEERMGVLLNYCLDVFTDAAIPVAVRVHAMQILFNIAQKEPDFTSELIDLIEHEIEYHGTPGIKSRGQKLLKKLHQIVK